MITLNIVCETPEEAHTYLNAQKYLNLIQDMSMAINNIEKHGTAADFVPIMTTFIPEIHMAADHTQGAY